MTGTKLYINAHGHDIHKTAIAIATLLCHEKGYKILDGTVFKDKYYYKAEPDVYIEVPVERTTPQGKKIRGTKRYVIEIETDATASSVKKKTSQFHESVTNHELVVVDLQNRVDFRVRELWELIEARLP